jgi:hypothetical protein
MLSAQGVCTRRRTPVCRGPTSAIVLSPNGKELEPFIDPRFSSSFWQSDSAVRNMLPLGVIHATGKRLR